MAKNPFKGQKGKSETVSIDLSNVVTGYRIKEGKYRAKVASMVKDVSKSSGLDMYVVDFQICEGEYKGSKRGEKRQYFAMTEGALWRFKAFLQALELVNDAGQADFEISDVLGMEVLLTIKDDVDNKGNDISTVDKIERSPLGPNGDEDPEAEEDDDDDDSDSETEENDDNSDDSEGDDEEPANEADDETDTEEPDSDNSDDDDSDDDDSDDDSESDDAPEAVATPPEASKTKVKTVDKAKAKPSLK